MVKILEIDNCEECHWERDCFCLITGKQITTQESFPSWCSLQNKPEPITVKQLAEWSKEIHNWQEVVDKINAHFLGEKKP